MSAANVDERRGAVSPPQWGPRAKPRQGAGQSPRKFFEGGHAAAWGGNGGDEHFTDGWGA